MTHIAPHLRETPYSRCEWVVQGGRVVVRGADVDAERAAAELSGTVHPLVEATDAADQGRVLLGLGEGAVLTERVLHGTELVGEGWQWVSTERDPLSLLVLSVLDRRYCATIGRSHGFDDLEKATAVAWASMAGAGISLTGTLTWLNQRANSVLPLVAAGAVLFCLLLLVALFCTWRTMRAGRPHLRISEMGISMRPAFMSVPLAGRHLRRWEGPPQEPATACRSLSLA